MMNEELSKAEKSLKRKRHNLQLEYNMIRAGSVNDKPEFPIRQGTTVSK